MKGMVIRYVAALMLALGGSAPAFAAGDQGRLTQGEVLCGYMKLFATSTMVMRQAGKPRGQVDGAEEGFPPGQWQRFAKGVVNTAYSIPRLETERKRQIAIKTFGDEIHKMCLAKLPG